MSDLHLTDSRDTLKMIRETLCVAQTVLGLLPHEDPRESGHRDRLGRIIDEIDRQRPLGSDDKHGERHTPTCGCEDKLDAAVEKLYPSDVDEPKDPRELARGGLFSPHAIQVVVGEPFSPTGRASRAAAYEEALRRQRIHGNPFPM